MFHSERSTPTILFESALRCPIPLGMKRPQSVTVNQLAEALGLPIKTIHGRLKRNGVAPLSRGAKGA